MKKKIFASLAVIMLMSLFSVPVLAGDINSNEQRIIAAISAVYEYDGAYYKVTDAYIAQVTAYLSGDDIDLSSSEVDDYLNQFYANIATGISSGYMECVGKIDSGKDDQGSNSGGSSNKNDENNSETTQQDSTTTSTEEEMATLIEGAIKVEDLTTGTASGDNTRGSTISGVQEYTVAEMDRQDMYVWETESLNVHTEAYKDSEIIGTLQKGDKVVVTGAATTGWARIEYNDGVGYVSSAYLRTPGYMIENGYIEVETTEEESTTEVLTSEEETTSEEESTVVVKDYSDAEPFQKGISLGTIAIVIVVIVAIAMAAVLIWHNRKNFRR